MESAAEMGATAVGDWSVGGRCAEGGNVLHPGGSVGAPLQDGVMGNVPVDLEGARKI